MLIKEVVVMRGALQAKRKLALITIWNDCA